MWSGDDESKLACGIVEIMWSGDVFGFFSAGWPVTISIMVPTEHLLSSQGGGLASTLHRLVADRLRIETRKSHSDSLRANSFEPGQKLRSSQYCVSCDRLQHRGHGLKRMVLGAIHRIYVPCF